MFVWQRIFGVRAILALVCLFAIVMVSLPTTGQAFAEAHFPQFASRSASNAQDCLQSGGSNPDFYYVTAYQCYNGVGTYAKMSQEMPYLDPKDYHSLAEIAVGSQTSADIVEVGWTVDLGRKGYSDSLPHLFVFYWVDGKGKCYNTECSGWVQVSSKSGHHPGDAVDVTSNPEQYGIYYSQGNWWINYQNDWIGYYPGSLWKGKFTQSTIVEWFGEVDSPNQSRKPCTQMGNGTFGHTDGSAKIDDMGLIDSQGNQWVANATLVPLSDASLYDAGHFVSDKTAFHSFTYGGPGACHGR